MADLESVELRGVELKGADLRGAQLSGADLRDANLSGAELRGATLNNVDLRGAYLGAADLRDASLAGGDLRRAGLRGADLGGANVVRVDLKEASLWKTDLIGARLGGSDLGGADMRQADLTGAQLGGTDLGRADLREALLTRAALIETDVSDAELGGATLSEAQYQARSTPDEASVTGLVGLRTVWFEAGEQDGLVLLRRTLREAGLRELEREATFALEHWKTVYSPQPERFLKWLLFEATTAWGMQPARALWILAALIVVFAVPYNFAVRSPGRDGIWKVWSPERLRDDLGGEGKELVERRGLSAFGLSLYFSVLSAFHFGWRELNVGNWIARIQPRECTFRATGWAKVVAGVQSLISVYLVAIWALTYFGRPFQ